MGAIVFLFLMFLLPAAWHAFKYFSQMLCLCPARWLPCAMVLVTQHLTSSTADTVMVLALPLVAPLTLVQPKGEMTRIWTGSELRQRQQC
jgi:hypothetical protein